MDFSRTVYAIRHNVTNRVYIGSSSRVDQRLKNHILALRRRAHPVEDMQEDFDKYGEDYTFTILEVITDCNDCDKEYEWMEKYQSHIRGIGYNYKDRIFRQKHNLAIKHTITYNGKTMPISKWAEEVGIPYSTLYDRVCVRCMDAAKALTTPIGGLGERHPQNEPRLTLTFNEKTMHIKDWAVLVNIPYNIIYNRVYELNWDVEKALTTPVEKQGGHRERRKVSN